ncbi:MAG TPA: hypothetical protein VFU47_12925 [Armatimonadota bacterium]|nr:hypothetical protein [Armatimonadota bacterium]
MGKSTKANTRARNQHPVFAEGDFTPFRIDTSAPPVEAERVPVFYIDDTEYTIPAQVSAATAMQALEIAVTKGPTAAAWHMISEALGEEGIRALQECRHITHEQVRGLFAQIGRIYFGQMEDMVGADTPEGREPGE